MICRQHRCYTVQWVDMHFDVRQPICETLLTHVEFPLCDVIDRIQDPIILVAISLFSSHD